MRSRGGNREVEGRGESNGWPKGKRKKRKQERKEGRKEIKKENREKRKEGEGRGLLSCLRDGVLGKVVAEAAHDVDGPGPVVLGLVGHEGRHDGYAEVALRVVGPLLVGLALAGHGALVPFCCTAPG